MIPPSRSWKRKQLQHRRCCVNMKIPCIPVTLSFTYTLFMFIYLSTSIIYSCPHFPRAPLASPSPLPLSAPPPASPRLQLNCSPTAPAGPFPPSPGSVLTRPPPATSRRRCPPCRCAAGSRRRAGTSSCCRAGRGPAAAGAARPPTPCSPHP